MSGELSPEEAASVIRRAAELDAGRVPGLPDDAGLDRDAVSTAALEAGISGSAVRRALAELDAGGLAPVPTSGMFGPGSVTVERIVPRHTGVATAAIHAWLKSQTFEIDRKRGQHTTWVRRADWFAKARRAVDLRKSLKLRDVESVSLSVARVDDRQTLVRITASHEETKQGYRIGAIGVPAVGTPIVAVTGGVVLDSALIALGSVPVGAALAAVGVLGGRRALQRLNADAEKTLELVLEEL